jgi:hypothetical protein
MGTESQLAAEGWLTKSVAEEITSEKRFKSQMIKSLRSTDYEFVAAYFHPK